MKKLWMFMPAALLMACGAETETITEPVTEKVEEITEEVIPEVYYTPDSSAEETIQAYLKEKKWDGVRHESGMYVVTDSAGGEEKPNMNDEVTIFYQGYLLDGKPFDGTQTDPATFRLDQLIPGWQLGIPMFGKGGSGKLIIPPGLAYGPEDMTDPDGSVRIPGNSTLMFEIQLVDFKKAGPKKQQMFW